MPRSEPTVVFDLFGTLLDVSSLRDVVKPYANQPDTFVSTWRQKQLGYAFASTGMGCYENFNVLTGYALDYAASADGVTLTAETRRTLLLAWDEMSPYPDAVACLSRLRGAGYRCDVLTNATLPSAETALRHAGLRELIDEIHTVDRATIYKPSPQAYAVVTTFYERPASDFVFVTGNGWDATGAAAFGMRVAWCNRAHAPAETFGPVPAWTVPSLAELPGTVAPSVAHH